MRRALFVLALVGCTSSELAPPVYVARKGPAAERVVRHVVALPSTCGSLATFASATYQGQKPLDGCHESYRAATDQVIRAQLDFLGLHVIDAEKVNAATATRKEVITRRDLSESKSVEQEKWLFLDATPNEQAEILRDLHADAVLNTRIFIGATLGMGLRRRVTVQVRLRAVSDGALIWAHRCEVEIGGIEMDVDGIQAAARCAMGRGA